MLTVRVAYNQLNIFPWKDEIETQVNNKYNQLLSMNQLQNQFLFAIQMDTSQNIFTIMQAFKQKSHNNIIHNYFILFDHYNQSMIMENSIKNN